MAKKKKKVKVPEPKVEEVKIPEQPKQPEQPQPEQPKPEEKPKILCEKCGIEMTKDGYGIDRTDYKCPQCGAGKSVTN